MLATRPVTVGVVVVSLGLCVAGAALAREPRPQRCRTGRFVVGTSLIQADRESQPDVVELEGRKVSISSGCEPTIFRLHMTRKGMIVNARWPRCGSLRKVHLRARLDANCEQMSGTLTARDTRRQAFEAGRSTCGDGLIDVAGGESCDPPNTASSCPEGQVCGARCSCVPAGVATTSTSSSTTTSSSSTTTTLPPSMSLTVSPLELSPAFSPSIHDYAVKCAAGTNDLTFQIVASSGGSVSLLAPTTTPWTDAATVAVQLEENQAAVVQATDGGTTVEEYWIRCLPHDFPVLSATPHPEVGEPTPGWYAIGNAFVASDSDGYAMIVDANGTPVWYHHEPGGAVDVLPLPDNTVAVAPLLGASFGTDSSRGVTLYHLDPWATQAILTVDAPTDHHEILPLANGHWLLLAYPLRSGIDLTGLQSYSPDSTIADCVVQEIDPDGNLVWEWRAIDHIDPVRESTVPALSMVNGQPVVDVYHCNSIDVNDSDELLISARHLDAVFLVSRATGSIAWKLGGHRSARMALRFSR